MVKLHENQRFKRKVRSIFDEDYTHEELVDELEEIYQNWNFMTFEEFKKRSKKDTDRMLKMQKDKICITK